MNIFANLQLSGKVKKGASGLSTRSFAPVEPLSWARELSMASFLAEASNFQSPAN